MNLTQIEVAVTNAVRSAMADLKEEAATKYQAARAADRKARKAKPKNGQRWVENYPLQITRWVEHGRENARVTVDGAPVEYKVMEQATYDQGVDRLWKLWMHTPDDHAVMADYGNKLEPLIQQAVVMAIGAAYYDQPSSETPAKRSGRK